MTTSHRALAACALLLAFAGAAFAQSGSIRGTVYDRDFEVPLVGATVENLETGQSAVTTELGSYLMTDVPPGTYTLVFSKSGYVRRLEADVVVTAGQLREVDAWLSGEFTDMEEFVVEDVLRVGAGTEAQLIQLRFESPQLLDSIGADLMSKAGASDAAAGLKLVAGASVQDGKSAVIRGLPDRYVSSQMNSVRLPSADEDKRAVELDQFPAAIIESIQVSKTFTPDQQGDASGGAVDVKLRGVPDETIFQVKGQLGYAAPGWGGDFLTYDDGGLDLLGGVSGHDLQPEGDWSGDVGAREGDAPIDFKLSLDMGRKWQLDDEWKIGGFVSLFYEHDSSYYDDGREDSLWLLQGADSLSPEYVQGAPEQGEFKTSLFDIEHAEESVRLGTLATVGIESEEQALDLTFLRTRVAEDSATVAIDTRGKDHYFPGYDPGDPTSPGYFDTGAAPYIRTDTLEYTERTTQTLQLHGRHVLPVGGFDVGSAFRFEAPELEWVASRSSADLDQPDARQFAATWFPFLESGFWGPYKPAASYRLGNLQRTFKTIEEDSEQYSVDLELPFEQWSGLPGAVKLGLFDDAVEREFRNDSYSNFNENSSYEGGFDDPWSGAFEDEVHDISDDALTDVNYDAELDVSAWYSMLEMPLTESVGLVGGVRFESTDITTIVDPEEDALWLDPDSLTNTPEDIEPGEADAAFSQDDVLPALGISYRPVPSVTLRGSYSQTIARQTFKELTPILQQDYAGAPVFVGNPDLEMSNLDNYDLRLDYAPAQGSLFSLSWFYKSIENPIEYVQKVYTFSFTQPENYPRGELSGYEIEVRQDLGRFAEPLGGLSVGANATFIDSEVDLPADEAARFAAFGIDLTSRDATNAPEYLYNLYLTYDLDGGETQVGLFYTVQGDTLLSGAGIQGTSGPFVPSIYQDAYGTLNLSIVRRLGSHLRLQLQAKNLTDPDIQTSYRADVIDGDTTRSSYSKGREFTLGLSINL